MGTGSGAGWTEIAVALCRRGRNAFSLSAPDREDPGIEKVGGVMSISAEATTP